jgi:ATP-dependent DNA helicase PIF1
MLNEMRYGNLSPGTIQAFKRLSRNIEYKDGIAPTELYAMRHEVSTANAMRLDQLRTETRTFNATDIPGYDSEGNRISEQRKRNLLEKLVCQESVTLKVGAQVMLIKVGISTVQS